MNSEQNLTREEAIAILNTPDEQLNELIERAGALRKKYKGNQDRKERRVGKECRSRWSPYH